MTGHMVPSARLVELAEQIDRVRLDVEQVLAEVEAEQPPTSTPCPEVPTERSGGWWR